MSKNKDKSCPVMKTSIGGQALMEGILMRGPERTAVVVRTAEGLVTKVDPTDSPAKKHPFLGWPLIRGTVSFVTSLVTGMKALQYSACSFLSDFKLITSLYSVFSIFTLSLPIYISLNP